MFCSKCGKTLTAAAEHCPSCGQMVGDSRFDGVPYTSAQVRIVPGAAHAAGEALPYTRTTYTGMDEQIQADADVDARTTYRPVYEGSSVPEGIRRDVRAAVGGDGETEAIRRQVDEDPLVREMFSEDEDAGIDDFDLSQLRPRPIVSEGRAGISRDVTEYVERLEATSDRGTRRARRHRIYGEAEEGASYEEVGEDVFQEAEDGEAPVYDAGGTLRLVAKIAGVLAVLAVLAIGGKLIYDKVNQIREGTSTIAGVTESLRTDGLAMINAHADTTYVDGILNGAGASDLTSVIAALSADAQAVTALLPAEPGVNDQLFVDALSAIQSNIGNAVTMDVVDMSGTVDAAALAQSEERWAVVRTAIDQLTAATTPEALAAIRDGEKVEVVTPKEPDATATPVPYKTLSKGDKSEDVFKLQQRLYELGFLLEGIDSAYGSKTQTAIKKFQSVAGLDVTGIADSLTQQRLYADDAPRTADAQPTQAAPAEAPDVPATEAGAEAGVDGGGEPTLLTSLALAA